MEDIRQRWYAANAKLLVENTADNAAAIIGQRAAAALLIEIGIARARDLFGAAELEDLVEQLLKSKP